MGELENLVFRNGKWYDRRTSNRVFVKAESGFAKPPLKQPTMSVEGVGAISVPPEGDSATESLTGGLQGIVKPPVKRTGGRPRKQTT